MYLKGVKYMNKKTLIVFGTITIVIILVVTFSKINTRKKSMIESTNISNNNTQKKEQISSKNNWDIDRIKIIVKTDSITKTSAIINIEDQNENPKEWELNFGIQRAGDNNTWVDLISKVRPMSLHTTIQPNENGITEIPLDWTEMYGELSEGTYRIVKYNGMIKLYSEPFTINH